MGFQVAKESGTAEPSVIGIAVVKVSVLSTGDISADGQKVTIAELAAKLAKVKAASGQVWYYREDAGGEPPAAAIQVIRLVVDNQLPISLSTKPDFSDRVDESGKAHQK
jgi:copper chaperone CopZ